MPLNPAFLRDWSGPEGSPASDNRLPVAPPLGTPFRNLVHNYADNPSLEASLANWASVGSNTLIRDLNQAYYGATSARATYQNDLRLAIITLPPSAYPVPGELVTLSAQVMIPAAWNGGAIQIDDGSTMEGGSLLAAETSIMTDRDAWVPIKSYLRNGGNDGQPFSVTIKTLSAPTAGQFIYIDALMVNRGTSIPLNYFDGDSADAEWLGTPDLAISQKTLQPFNNPPAVDWSITDIFTDFDLFT